MAADAICFFAARIAWEDCNQELARKLIAEGALRVDKGWGYIFVEPAPPCSTHVWSDSNGYEQVPLPPEPHVGPYMRIRVDRLLKNPDVEVQCGMWLGCSR